ncbi:glycosyl hydrolases family 18-domain-containing protein [Fennellomyces sp. T-0311]|nr:glycosyl hydrolases family 18-domain-containing protein [Fennellomyces sp. T-0311]
MIWALDQSCSIDMLEFSLDLHVRHYTLSEPAESKCRDRTSRTKYILLLSIELSVTLTFIYTFRPYTMADRRSILCTVIFTPIVLILLILGWQRGGINDVEKIVPADPAPPSLAREPIIAGYFVNWGIYDRNYNVIDIEAEKLSHVLYAFANLLDDGTIILGDDWADKDKHFPAKQAVNGKSDDWNELGHNLYGNLKQLYLLKQKNRHLKVSLSIGGWSWSGNFSTVAADVQKRSQFTATVASYIYDLGLDGVDIDWEMPKDDTEAVSYVTLLQDLRGVLGPDYLISVAVPCGPSDYEKLHLSEMAAEVDLFYLMAYDFAGAWDPVTGHQASLYGGELNDNRAVEYYIQNGVPAKKIVLGIPAYGRAFSKTDGKVGASFDGVPSGTWEAGSYDYKELPRPGATEYFDEKQVASYSYDPEGREFVTYDNPAVVKAKCDYALEKGLAGVMFWELSADAKTPDRSLVHAAYTAFGQKVDSTPNQLDYPSSQFDNVRSGM